MNKIEIIKIAQECGAKINSLYKPSFVMNDDQIVSFYKTIEAHTKERCVDVCKNENVGSDIPSRILGVNACIQAIESMA